MILLRCLSFVIGVVFVGCSHSKKEPVKAVPLREWAVGPVTGQISTSKKWKPKQLAAELECHGRDKSGTPWTATQTVPSRVSLVKETEGEAVFRLRAEASILKFPAQGVRSCAYLLKITGPHPNSRQGSGRFPVVGDVAVGGMPREELEQLLQDQKLHEKISQKLENLEIRH
ncbi:MAG: hypothetical protein ACK5Y2_08605 [Bdellovibrionales bacterium]